MPRTTRKSLKTLQRPANDSENLVGRPSKSLKHQLSQESPKDIEIKIKNTVSKETQANLEVKILQSDLTNPDGASETYWQVLAANQKSDLEKALNEIEKLSKLNEDLREENVMLKQMLEEANSFVEVIKEELQNVNNDDTGIDINDVSQSESTVDDAPNNSESVDKEY